MVISKTPGEIERMRAAGAVVARCLRDISEQIVPGVTTTLDIDLMADELVRKHGGVSSFKNYRGYPNTVCVAVNEEVVHGIPSPDRILEEGDIISIDIPKRTLSLEVTDEEIARRRMAWQRPAREYSGVLRRYVAFVTGADTGAVLGDGTPVC